MSSFVYDLHFAFIFHLSTFLFFLMKSIWLYICCIGIWQLSNIYLFLLNSRPYLPYYHFKFNYCCLFYFSSCKYFIFLLLQVFLLLLHVINCNSYFLFCSFASNFYQLFFHSYYQFNFSFFFFTMFLFRVFSIIVFQISIQLCFEFVDNKAIKALVISSYHLTYLTSLWLYDYF